MHRSARILAALFVSLLLATAASRSSFAQDTRQLVRETTDKRLALVIGNGTYENSPLRNPVNDATDISAALQSIGFEVILRTDIDQEEMKRAINEFGDRLREQGGTGLFYFAGHGVQVGGRNYLIPVTAKVTTEEDVEYEGVDVGRLLAKMRAAGNRMNIVILDACRNNPFARSFRSADQGLASIDAPSGTIIAYATAPGSVASDGTGRNGLYTEELLKQIRTPGLSIEEAFKRVRVAVRARTNESQTPWESSSLTGNFYFMSGGGEDSVAVSTPISVPRPVDVPRPVVAEPVSRTASVAEKASWDLVKDSEDASDIRLYLEQFPNGVYASEARGKIKQMESAAWDQVKDSKDPGKIADFLRAHPEGEFSPLARILIKTIEDSDEYKTWKAAEQSRTIESYRAYLQSFPDGVYSETAATLLAELEARAKEARRPAKGKMFKNSLGIEFMGIPPGQFLMGSPKNEKDREKDENPFEVTISQPYWIGKYEVTQEQWRAVMGSVPEDCYKGEKVGGDKNPVVCVSWDDVQAFIGKLNERGEGFYRLPTEAEWEYAARAGTTDRYFWGEMEQGICDYANTKSRMVKAINGRIICSDDFKGTSPAGSFQPNGFGLHDTSGNVWEWVGDWYGAYPNGPQQDPAGPAAGQARVYRGGSTFVSRSDLRSAKRGQGNPATKDYSIGFRLVMEFR